MTRMATRRKTTPAPVEETPVTAEEYTEDESWDGSPEEAETTEADEESAEQPKKRGRQVSPLIVATREYESAQRHWEKCERALSKVKPLAEAEETARKTRDEAYTALETELAKVHS